MPRSCVSVAEILTAEELTVLEALVDRRTLSSVLGALSDICFAKQEHVQSNWQDDKTAKTWKQDGDKIGAVSVKIQN